MSNYIIIDFECTCWDRNDPNYREHEIIEIGTVFLNGKYEKIDEQDLFVTPRDNPILSDYCIGLTGITQKELDKKGISFKSAISALSAKISLHGGLFCSWGEFDKNQLKDECEDRDVKYPFPTEDHLNIKTEFLKQHNKRKMGLQKACKFYKLRFNGVPHNALCDANMTAEIFSKMRSE